MRGMKWQIVISREFTAVVSWPARDCCKLIVWGEPRDLSRARKTIPHKGRSADVNICVIKKKDIKNFPDVKYSLLESKRHYPAG